MGLFRSALLKHPVLALAIGLAALALRLAVPAGFMPVLDHGGMVLAPCPGFGSAEAAAPSSLRTMPGMSHHQPGEAQVQASCAFADLSLSMIGGGGGPLALAAAIVFFILTGPFLLAAVPAGPAPRLRPPLRGPPLPR